MATQALGPQARSGPPGPRGPQRGGGGKLPEPNLEKFTASLKEIDEQINGLTLQIKEADQEIKTIGGDRSTFQRERDEIMRNLKEVDGSIKEGNDKKKRIDDAITDLTKKGREVKDKMNSIKRTVGYGSEADIDAEIKKIEHTMMTGSLSMKEEKQMMHQIKELRGSKSEVGKLDDLRQDPALDTSSIDPLRKEQTETRDELNKLWTTRKELKEKLTAATAEWDNNNAPVKAAFEKRAAFRKELVELNNKKGQVMNEMEDERRRFHKAQIELRRQREQKMREERAAKAHEDSVQKLKLQLEDQQSEPYSHELNEMKVARTYLKTLQPIQDVDATEEAAKNEPESLVTADGEEIVVPKKFRVQEAYAAPKGKKSKAKKKNAEPKKNKGLTHEIRIMADFRKLDVPLPLWTDEIPNSMAILEKKLIVLEKAHQKEMDKWNRRREITEKQLAALEAGKSLDEVKAIGKEFRESSEPESAPAEGDAEPEQVKASEGDVANASPVGKETSADELPKTDTGSTDNPESAMGTSPVPADASPEETPAPVETKPATVPAATESPEAVEEAVKDPVKESNTTSTPVEAAPPAETSSSESSSDSDNSD